MSSSDRDHLLQLGKHKLQQYRFNKSIITNTTQSVNHNHNHNHSNNIHDHNNTNSTVQQGHINRNITGSVASQLQPHSTNPTVQYNQPNHNTSITNNDIHQFINHDLNSSSYDSPTAQPLQVISPTRSYINIAQPTVNNQYQYDTSDPSEHHDDDHTQPHDTPHAEQQYSHENTDLYDGVNLTYMYNNTNTSNNDIDDVVYGLQTNNNNTTQHAHHKSTIPIQLMNNEYHPALDILSQSSHNIYEHMKSPQSNPIVSPNPAYDDNQRKLSHTEHDHALHDANDDITHRNGQPNELNDSLLTLEHLGTPVRSTRSDNHTTIPSPPHYNHHHQQQQQQQQSLLNTINTLNNELDTLRRSQLQSDNVIKTLQLKLSKQSDELMDLRQDNIRLINEFESNDRLSAIHSETQSCYSNTIDSKLLSNIQQHIEELDQLHRSNSGIITNTSDSLHTAIQIINELQSQYNNDNQAINTVQSLITDAKHTIDRCDINHITQQLQSIHTVLNPLNSLIASSNTASRQTSPPQHLQHNDYAIQSMKQQYEHTISELTESIQSLTARCNEMTRDKYVLARKIEDTYNDHDAVTIDLNNRLNECISHNQQCMKYIHQLQHTLTQHSVTIPQQIDEQSASEQISRYLSSSTPYNNTMSDDMMYNNNGNTTINDKQLQLQRYYTPQIRRSRPNEYNIDQPSQQTNAGILSRLLTLLFGESDDVIDDDDPINDKVLIV